MMVLTSCQIPDNVSIYLGLEQPFASMELHKIQQHQKYQCQTKEDMAP